MKGILLAAESEFHQVVTLLLGRLSVEHSSSKSKDPGTAFSEILASQSNLQNIKALTYEENSIKIYDAAGNLKPSIVISEIDTSLVIEFLRKINGMIPGLTKKCIKKPKNHPNCCIVSHHSPGSYRIINGKCDHCGIDEVICLLDNALEHVRKLRNTGAHITETTGANFLKKSHIFSDFPSCHDVEQLFGCINKTMDELLQFMDCQTYFPTLNVLDKRESLSHSVLLEKKLKSTTIDLDTYFSKDIVVAHQRSIAVPPIVKKKGKYHTILV